MVLLFEQYFFSMPLLQLMALFVRGFSFVAQRCYPSGVPLRLLRRSWLCWMRYIALLFCEECDGLY